MRLKFVVEQTEMLKVRDREIEKLKAQLLLKDAEAAVAICLRAEASKLEDVKKSLENEVKALKGRNATLENENNDLDVKVVDLAALVKVREHEVTGLDVVVTFVKSRNNNLVEQVVSLYLWWLLAHDMKLVITKCLNSPEYLFAPEADISKAIEKGMKYGKVGSRQMLLHIILPQKLITCLLCNNFRM
nr:hypothetical protein [Tanacetum cinerariifolium]